MQRVDEIVLSDLTPEALQNRMKRGDIYPLDRAERAFTNFFRPGNLIALREIALQQVSHVVDRRWNRISKRSISSSARRSPRGSPSASVRTRRPNT